MTVLLVTGGIGSGKSLVCSILKEKYGIPVYVADLRAKQLYNEFPSMLAEIEKVIGIDLRDSNGGFVSARLAKVIFSDCNALKKVEDILFPVMKKDFEQWALKQKSNVVAFESATVLEKQQFDDFGDIVLLVDAPLNVRMTRAMMRDCASREDVQSRIDAQVMMNTLSEGGRNPRVNHVLINDSTEDDLRRKLANFIEMHGLTKML